MSSNKGHKVHHLSHQAILDVKQGNRFLENFNYIAFGNRDHVTGQVDEISMNRGRIFEYTPPEVAAGLEALDTDAIRFLQTLPTFLCSEINWLDTGATMIVRYGHIHGTTVDKREVTTHFETVLNLGEVRFESVDQAKKIFETDGFQLYRTHWAVRSGSAKKILSQLSELSTANATAVASLSLTGEATAQTNPPERKKNIAGEANSVESYLQILEGLPPDQLIETFYRGHEDSSFELAPSLLRKWPDGAWKFLPNEDRLCKELLIAHYDDFLGDQYCFDKLVRMQHYGLPTRLLDISSNPLVALFFACFGKPETKAAAGEVVVFRIASDSVKYFDSDTVSCLANLSNLTNSQKNEIDLTQTIPDFNATGVAKKLLHNVRAEKGFFEARIVPDDLGSIVCVKAKRTNSRIRSQSGAFLLFGHEAILPEAGQENIEIARITVANKAHILQQLDALNVNAKSVYPSIEQTAVHLRSHYQLQAKDI